MKGIPATLVEQPEISGCSDNSPTHALPEYQAPCWILMAMDALSNGRRLGVMHDSLRLVCSASTVLLNQSMQIPDSHVK